MVTVLEYIWIDANNNLRSKGRVSDVEFKTVEELPYWIFDGSSTRQAVGFDSDVILRPVSMFPDPFRKGLGGFLVMCETFDKNGEAHVTNKRIGCAKSMSDAGVVEQEVWFGIEQEYILYERDMKKPLKWVSQDEPGLGEQGPYYCAVGADRAFGRKIVEAHLEMCIYAKLKIGGINGEVMPSQWEYQLGPLPGLVISDQLWVSRYILNRVCEMFDCCVSFLPKPLKEWNGSGAHTNFSTKKMRAENGLEEIKKACIKLGGKHKEHLEVYGENNIVRLTGMHETASFHKYSYGIGDRGASVRIPLLVFKDKKGYLEDRRPAANMDPYLVTEILVRTICM
ncbi:MAG: glutamine synthetase [Hyperionvirus sp.]|uniref:glutamine synthetase n=1 Tax=Hyperionvirus sp. TaxID=2487770 RepID=A0A3G5A9C8_9VIRU|nr:MAG: glutamine synthetase [Hyperionvirus sp.]